MVAFKFSLKVRAPRKISSSYLHSKSVDSQSKVSRLRTTKAQIPAFLSTLQSSSVKAFARSNGHNLGFLTGSRRRPIQKRRVIHVATLNFGPFEDFTPEFAMALMRKDPTPPHEENTTNTLHQVPQGTHALPEAALHEHASSCRVPYANVSSSLDATIPFTYSRESWVDVSYPEPQAAITILSPSLATDD